ncbi:MAG TPA: RluA family pseudouridine synthase [Candidatus Omnitrophica bacterium]|nr:RluA family pseudouridine synthase [Candidatus Omnitrophota bacterium]
MQEYIFEVEEGANIRLDLYLVEKLSEGKPAFSRVFIQKLIRSGDVSVDRNPAKANQKIKPSQVIRVVIPPEPEKKLKAQDIPLEIVYEDDDLLVVNKSRGLVVHPASGNLDGTLVNALLFYSTQLSSINPERPGLVHRLDKDTAGLLLVAKNNPAHLHLSKQFSEHSIKRIYVAFVSGVVEFDEGVIDLPIGRHPTRREKMAVNFKVGGRPSSTRYRVIKRYSKFSHLELTPQTGRTHQLRVHMASLGHSILGDVTYGKKDKSIKLALYAKYIGFIHPTSGKFIEFEHVLPDDMQNILDNENK